MGATLPKGEVIEYWSPNYRTGEGSVRVPEWTQIADEHFQGRKARGENRRNGKSKEIDMIYKWGKDLRCTLFALSRKGRTFGNDLAHRALRILKDLDCDVFAMLIR